MRAGFPYKCTSARVSLLAIMMKIRTPTTVMMMTSMLNDDDVLFINACVPTVHDDFEDNDAGEEKGC